MKTASLSQNSLIKTTNELEIAGTTVNLSYSLKLASAVTLQIHCSVLVWWKVYCKTEPQFELITSLFLTILHLVLFPTERHICVLGSYIGLDIGYSYLRICEVISVPLGKFLDSISC
jgi:hypothetical protein